MADEGRGGRYPPGCGLGRAARQRDPVAEPVATEVSPAARACALARGGPGKCPRSDLGNAALRQSAPAQEGHCPPLPASIVRRAGWTIRLVAAEWWRSWGRAAAAAVPPSDTGCFCLCRPERCPQHLCQ